MLSVQECKKHLPAGRYDECWIKEIRDELYQLATILVSSYIERNRLRLKEAQIKKEV